VKSRGPDGIRGDSWLEMTGMPYEPAISPGRGWSAAAQPMTITNDGGGFQ